MQLPHSGQSSSSSIMSLRFLTAGDSFLTGAGEAFFDEAVSFLTEALDDDDAVLDLEEGAAAATAELPFLNLAAATAAAASERMPCSMHHFSACAVRVDET